MASAGKASSGGAGGAVPAGAGGRGSVGAGGQPGAGPVAATPGAQHAPHASGGDPRGRSASRDRHGDGQRGRSWSRGRGRPRGHQDGSRSTNRSRSQSVFRDRNTGEVLSDRLFTLSKTLVRICRHQATSLGITVSPAGWITIGQALVHANRDRVDLINRDRKGKGRGGGNAPPRRQDLMEAYSVNEVITIVTRAVRPHLGLMENHAGEIISIRAWEYHAGLRSGQALRDYDLEMLESTSRSRLRTSRALR